MKSSIRICMAAGLVACATTMAMAQPGGGRGGPGGRGGFGGGGFGGGGSLMLLQDENVRKDLGVTDDQIKRLEEKQEKMRGEISGLFQSLRDLDDEERQAKFQEIQKKMTAITEAAQKEVLLPKQIERLKQISIQSRLNRGGTSDALASDELSKELGITEAQKEALRKAQEEADAEMRDKINKFREEARQKILNVLTAEQQAKLKKLTGETIEFAPQRFGGDRGGPGGPGGVRGGAGGRPGGGRPLSRPAEGD